MLEVQVGIVAALAECEAKQPAEIFIGKTYEGRLTGPRGNSRYASVHGLEVLPKGEDSAMGPQTDLLCECDGVDKYANGRNEEQCQTEPSADGASQ